MRQRALQVMVGVALIGMSAGARAERCVDCLPCVDGNCTLRERCLASCTQPLSELRDQVRQQLAKAESDALVDLVRAAEDQRRNVILPAEQASRDRISSAVGDATNGILSALGRVAACDSGIAAGSRKATASPEAKLDAALATVLSRARDASAQIEQAVAPQRRALDTATRDARQETRDAAAAVRTGIGNALAGDLRDYLRRGFPSLDGARNHGVQVIKTSSQRLAVAIADATTPIASAVTEPPSSLSDLRCARARGTRLDCTAFHDPGLRDACQQVRANTPTLLGLRQLALTALATRSTGLADELRRQAQASRAQIDADASAARDAMAERGRNAGSALDAILRDLSEHRQSTRPVLASTMARIRQCRAPEAVPTQLQQAYAQASSIASSLLMNEARASAIATVPGHIETAQREIARAAALRRGAVEGDFAALARTTAELEARLARASLADLAGMRAELTQMAQGQFPALDQRADQVRAALASATTTARQRFTDDANHARGRLENRLVGAASGAFARAQAHRARSFATLNELIEAQPRPDQLFDCVCRNVDVAWLPVSLGGTRLDDVRNAFCLVSNLRGLASTTAPNLDRVPVDRAAPVARAAPTLPASYDPTAALSEAARAELFAKADRYETVFRLRNFHTPSDYSAVGCVEIDARDPSRIPYAGCGNGTMSNTGIPISQYMAALAFRLSATKPDERGEVRTRLNTAIEAWLSVSTIAAAAHGSIFTVNTRERVQPVVGAPVTGWARCTEPCTFNEHQPSLAADTCTVCGASDRCRKCRAPEVVVDEHTQTGLLEDDEILGPNSDTFAFVGRLDNTPGTGDAEYRFVEIRSGDDTHWRMFAAAAAYDALRADTGADTRELRRRLVTAVVDFLHWYVPADPTLRYQFRGMLNAPTPPSQGGNASNNSRLDLLVQNLAWLKVGIYLSKQLESEGGPTAPTDLQERYNELTGSAFGQGRTPKEAAALGSILAWPFLRLSAKFVYTIVGVTSVQFMTLDSYLLHHYETDQRLQRIYWNILTGIVWPQVEYTRSPFAMALLLPELGRAAPPHAEIPDFAAHIAAILRQYRDVPAPFGNPMPNSGSEREKSTFYTDFRNRPELRDLGYEAVRLAWAAALDGPNRRAFVAFLFACFGQTLDDDAINKLPDTKGARIPLGPGLVPVEWEPYNLVGSDDEPRAQDDRWRIHAQSPTLYLLGYWTARFHQIVPAPRN